MKKPLLLATALLAAAVYADETKPAAPPAPPLGPKAEALIEQLLPVCSEAATPKRVGLVHSLPANMTGNVVQLESKRNWCAGQWVAIVTKEGGFYLGIPWFLDDQQGTLEEKLKAFAWQNMQQNFTVMVDRTKTRDGLYKVKLVQTTEAGKVPYEGEVDPAGTVFFLGHFMPLDTEVRGARVKALGPMVAKSPATGAATPRVTVIEFSDFECPSCQHAAGYLKPILAAHGDQVRYIRFDTPLMMMHPWAFNAAVAGRAVYRQNPELFWKFKEQIYENQDKLNAFVLDDFVKGFARDHDLDMKKFEADLNSPEVKNEILSGVAAAFSNDIRSTPTYLVNGVAVDPGSDGKALAAYVEKALTGSATPGPKTPSGSGR